MIDGKLTPGLVQLARELDDEFSPRPTRPPVNGDGGRAADQRGAEEMQVTLSFPHRRVGTLPLSPRLAHLFPTALVSPRVRFMFVDGDSGQRFPGWVVRQGKYVFGLDEWYRSMDFPVGGYVNLQRGDAPGEVVVRAKRHRPTREWVRTAAAGPDGRLAFTMQKQLIGVDYDELMMVAAGNLTSVDEVWLKSQSLSFRAPGGRRVPRAGQAQPAERGARQDPLRRRQRGPAQPARPDLCRAGVASLLSPGRRRLLALRSVALDGVAASILGVFE